MKAIRVREFGNPEVMRLEDAPDPRPGPGQVVLRVKAAGVNPVDTYLRSGGYAIKPALPYTPGSDAAGIVESVGEAVAGVAAGARVYASGTLSGAYAEQALCDERQVHPLPGNVSFAQGAAVGIPYGTAYYALFQRAKARAGEIVLVHGATGGVGIAAVQLARAAGMRVIGTGSTERGRALVLGQGADHALNHGESGFLEKLSELTGGHGADLIIEMLANVNLGMDLKALAGNGRIVIVGSRGRVEIDPRDAMSRNASILGMLLHNASREEEADLHEAIDEGLESGRLRPVVGREFPLSEAPLAHHAVMEPGACGKIVLIP